MESSDTLLSLAGLAVTLIGFSAIVAAQLLHAVTPGPYVAAAIWQLLAAALFFLTAFTEANE